MKTECEKTEKKKKTEKIGKEENVLQQGYNQVKELNFDTMAFLEEQQ